MRLNGVRYVRDGRFWSTDPGWETVGDPTDPATDVGPMARDDLRDALERQVAASVGSGARILLGGDVRGR